MRWSPGLRRFLATGTILTLVLGLALAGNFAPAGSDAQSLDASSTVSIGESNDETQRAELLDYFGVDDASDVVDVTVQETLQTWEGVFDLSGVDSAYSSTSLTCSPAESGVDVATRNIEMVPPELYALTLVTAGISDAQLVVAAPDDAIALGMTALTGVFKTWDLAPCAGMGNDPERRDLALRQLALIASIGQRHGGAGAVGQATELMLALQQSVVGGAAAPDELDELVTAQAEELGFPLDADEQASMVDFLDQLSGAQVEWGAFGDGWSVDYPDDDTRVLMRPGSGPDGSSGAEAGPAGVGGAIEAVPSATPTATAPATATPPVPTATPRAVTVPSPTATPTGVAAGVAGPTDIGGSPGSGQDDRPFPWWLLLGLIPFALLILLFARRRRRRDTALIANRVSPAWAVAAVGRRQAGEPVDAGTAIVHRTSFSPVLRHSHGWIRGLRRPRGDRRSPHGTVGRGISGR